MGLRQFSDEMRRIFVYNQTICNERRWIMKHELTLQEKLRDLRDERKLKLTELSEQTGIPASTLQRMESDEDIRIGYQDVRDLAKF
jgi:predicted transcriptional regulator